MSSARSSESCSIWFVCLKVATTCWYGITPTPPHTHTPHGPLPTFCLCVTQFCTTLLVSFICLFCVFQVLCVFCDFLLKCFHWFDFFMRLFYLCDFLTHIWTCVGVPVPSPLCDFLSIFLYFTSRSGIIIILC